MLSDLRFDIAACMRAEISRHICFTQQFKNTFRRQQPLDLSFTPPTTLRMPPPPFRGDSTRLTIQYNTTLRMPPLPFRGDSTRRTSLNSHAIQIQPTCTSAEEKLDFFPNFI